MRFASSASTGLPENLAVDDNDRVGGQHRSPGSLRGGRARLVCRRRGRRTSLASSPGLTRSSTGAGRTSKGIPAAVRSSARRGDAEAKIKTLGPRKSRQRF